VSKIVLRVALLLALPLCGLLAPVTAAPAAPAQSGGRLVILGFDGGDGRTVEEMMDAGELPNLSALRQEGTFARLGTSVPNESPTSWASLNTGCNPGKTNVSGFVKRAFNSKKLPSAGFGFLDTRDTRKIDEFEDLPLPAWNPAVLAAAVGGGTLAVFLIVFAGLLRVRFAVSASLAVVLGAVGAFVGFKARSYLPTEITRTANPNEGKNYWDHAADAGVKSIVLEAAQAFDMETSDGARMLAGLGVPDARGGIGDWFIYTDDELLIERPPEGKGTGTAGTKFRIDWRDGKIATQIYGPVNFYLTNKIEQELDAVEAKLDDPSIGYKESIALREQQDDLEDRLKKAKKERVAVDLVVEKSGENSASIVMDGTEQVLEVGQWSDFYNLTFPFNPMLEVKAVTRCKLVSLEEPFELFVNTIDIDPASPPFWQSISEPHGFAPELVRTSGGTFETYGWACATMPFKDSEVSAATLLEDIEFTMKWRERVTHAQLDRDDWRLFMSVFSTPDRVQHMMYKYYDEDHPQYKAHEANEKVTFFGKEVALKDAIPEIYRQADRIVGDVVAKLRPDDTLLVCSDHGFQSFRRQVHLNNWLHEHGYLAVKDGLKKSSGSNFAFVDWANTQAYAMGLGFIYVNQKGREGRGIVAEADKDALLAKIQADLLESVDPETGKKTVIESYRVADEHSGDFMDESPDLVLGFAPTYRVSWKTTGGGMQLSENDDDKSWGVGPTYTNNTSPWSGGHPSVARDHVRGIFFSNRKVDLPEGGPNLMHIAPTALAVLGVPIPPEMDLEPLGVR
jgi:predicted AlkP superfamily phosphohydrolase/phosphomutase